MTRDTALALLARHSHGAVWAKHCLAVAEAAARLGHALDGHRVIDHEFLWTAALLHDIGRHVTHDPIGHGAEGYRLLTGLGHGREANVCASHVLFGLEAAEAELFGLPARDFIPQTVEERLVALADLLLEYDAPTTLDHRFASLRARNAGNAFFLGRLGRARARAAAFLQQLDEEIGRPVLGILTDEMPGCGKA
jgi:uncharacterized protein